MNYKKITLSTFTILCSALHGIEQEITPVDRIFQEMQATINYSSKYDFDTIQDTHQGTNLIQKISRLTQDQKNTLLQRTYNTLKSDAAYPRLQLLAKLLVLSGADANLNLGRISRYDLLEKSLLEEDQKMLAFLLARHADTTNTAYSGGPLLNGAKTYPIALLLAQHDALKPYAFNASLQRKLLEKNFFHPEYDYRLAPLYKRELKKQYNVDLNFAGVDDHLRWTLLHMLCSSVSFIKPHDFFEKLRVLLDEKAVDLQAKTQGGERPIDIINKRLINSPNKPGLLFAQRVLTDLENNPLEFNVLTRKNQERQAKP